VTFVTHSVCWPSHDSMFSSAVSVATVVLAASQHGLLLQNFNWVFQYGRSSHINGLEGNTYMYMYIVAITIYIWKHKCARWRYVQYVRCQQFVLQCTRQDISIYNLCSVRIFESQAQIEAGTSQTLTSMATAGDISHGNWALSLTLDGKGESVPALN